MVTMYERQEDIPDRWPPIETTEQLRDLLHNDLVSRLLCVSMVGQMQESLSRCLAQEEREAVPLDEDVFRMFYDPAAPTIAVDYGTSFVGNELLGLAALESDIRANIIFINGAANHAEMIPDEDGETATLSIRAGAMVLPDGTIAYGVLPEAVSADALETTDNGLLRQCEAHDIAIFHHPDEAAELEDKSKVETLIAGSGVRIPDRISAVEFMASDTAGNIVIKPAKLSQGSGIIITGDHADNAHAKAVFKFLESRGYQPIVEARIKSFPMFDPDSGKRLDWNVRAVISNGQLVDMYFRVGTWGEPVNKSKAARAVSVEDIVPYFRDPAVSQQVIQALREAGANVARAIPISILNIDLTVNEALSACLFELNSGRGGGVQTIAELSAGYDNKLHIARHILQNLLRELPGRQMREAITAPGLSLEPSVPQQFRSIHSLLLDRHLSDLPPDVLGAETAEDRQAAVLRMLSRRLSDEVARDPQTVRTIEQEVLDRYPLEVVDYLPGIIATTPVISDYQPYVNMLEWMFPGDVRLPILRCSMAAANHDMAGYKARVEAVLARGGSYEEVERVNQPARLRTYRALLTGLEPAESRAVTNLIDNIWTLYIEEGYAAAAQLINNRQAEADEINTEVAPSLRFALAVGARQYDEALELYDQLTPDNAFATEFMQDLTQGFVKEGVDGLLFFAQISLKQGRFLHALLDSVFYLSRQAPGSNESRHLIAEFAKLAPYEGTSHDRQQFAALLQTVAEKRKPRARDPENISWRGLSDMAKFTLLMRFYLSGNYQFADAVFNDFYERGVMGEDAALYTYVTYFPPASS